MSRLPPFTLIHGAELRSDDRLATAADLFPGDSRLASRWTILSQPLRKALLASASSIAPDAAFEALATLVRDLDRAEQVETVGIWELDETAGILSHAIETLNAVQSAFTFFQIEAAVPAGLVSRATRLVTWAEEHGQVINSDQRQELEQNVIADDFFVQAARCRDELGLGLLAGVTGYLVAGLDQGSIFWDHFSSGHERLILVSTHDLRRFARLAGVPFEYAVARLVVEQVLTEVSPTLDFHAESHGSPCVFDLNDDRESIVGTLASPAIHADCLAKIPQPLRKAALAMVEALRDKQPVQA